MSRVRVADGSPFYISVTSGEVSERFKELVLKISDSVMGRGFESHPLRQENMEKYSSGWRGSPAKGVGLVNGREGSNPSFSAIDLRGVAQFGSARGLGPWGRGFESLHLDQDLLLLNYY